MKTLGATEKDLDFSIADNLPSVVQRVKQRLRFWRATWFIDLRAGVPYVPDLLGRRVAPDVAQQTITDAIRSVPDVQSVDNIRVSLDHNTRELFYSATIHTPFGEAEIEETF